MRVNGGGCAGWKVPSNQKPAFAAGPARESKLIWPTMGQDDLAAHIPLSQGRPAGVGEVAHRSHSAGAIFGESLPVMRAQLFLSKSEATSHNGGQ
jgi:hypothetical protein